MKRTSLKQRLIATLLLTIALVGGSVSVSSAASATDRGVLGLVN